MAAEENRRDISQQDFDTFVRHQLQGDWAKMENDDPEFMAAMRRFLGFEADGDQIPDCGADSEGDATS